MLSSVFFPFFLVSERMKLKYLKADRVPQTLTFHTVLSCNNFLWPSTAFNHSQNPTSYDKNKNKEQELQTNPESKWKFSQWSSNQITKKEKEKKKKRKKKKLYATNALFQNITYHWIVTSISMNNRLSMHLNIHRYQNPQKAKSFKPNSKFRNFPFNQNSTAYLTQE